MPGLPFSISEAIIQCFGRCFYYKDGVVSFMVSAGVKRTLVEKYRNEAKFVWARHVLQELETTEDGLLTQRRLLTELCKLKNIPDQNVPDRDSAINALRKLKELAVENDLLAKEESTATRPSSKQNEEKAKLIKERSLKLEDLRKNFASAFSTTNRQEAGYSLEGILKELFLLFEVEYRNSYRNETQQLDGHFNFNGFDYLVEAKWRSDIPPESEIGAFKHKVDTKLESTRGFFVSIQGFRDEVVNAFAGKGCNIIFMDGMDLTYILEGRVDLRDAIKFKIDKAAQEGCPFVSLKDKY